MRFVELLTCGALLAPAFASAASAPEYSAQVRHAYAPSNAVQRLAVMPFACPETIDCEKFTARVTKSLGKATKLNITPASRTDQVMTAAGIEKLDYEVGYILSEALNVHAFAVVDIEQASIDVTGKKQILLDGKQIQIDGPQVKHVKLHLKIVGKDGAELLAASGEAQLRSIFASLDDVAEQTFEVILEESLAKH